MRDFDARQWLTDLQRRLQALQRKVSEVEQWLQEPTARDGPGTNPGGMSDTPTGTADTGTSAAWTKVRPVVPQTEPKRRRTVKRQSVAVSRAGVGLESVATRVRRKNPCGAADSVVPRSAVNQRTRRQAGWTVSLMLHVGLLVGLACFSFTRGSLNPLHVLITLSNPPDPKSVDVALWTEPLVSEIAFEETVVVPDLPEPIQELQTEWDVTPRALTEWEPPPIVEAGDRGATETDLDRSAQGERSGPTRGAGRRGGPKGQQTVEFFGAQEVANRIAYLVDNSNSMHSGRFETALAELHRSVVSLSPDQEFYVAFFSDTAYGLFHPDTAPGMVPATPDHKRRFATWLATVQMCTGGRIREAFELVEPMEPHTVYLLSDGVIQGERTMEYLLDSSQRTFTVHCIGLTVPDPASARRLQAIAAAHGGNWQWVGVHPAARLMAQQRPIQRNRTRAPVWGIRLPGSGSTAFD